MLVAFLVGKDILDLIVREVEADSPGHQGHHRVLVQLVLKDRRIAEAGFAHTESLLGVLHGDVEAGPCRGDGEGGDTDPSREESLRHLEEPLIILFDVTNELAIRGHISKLRHHISPWDLDLVEVETSVVDSIDSDLPAHVHDGDARHYLALIISDSHKERIDPFILPLHYRLAEH
eukprot:CAMPEP_0170540436 /NCGR_PEP_ID=MMETSP0211-20121228/435_1 /TAXON_ID=311385 /ORGANISM="Pseudokeronopsis sp., Strain OXSARD2" /LENGTH=175 /DNA_ID=CAMNT_0010842851 /DNA_START=802 /DNA_END=1329 /DNA_ORIENTATION=-